MFDLCIHYMQLYTEGHIKISLSKNEVIVGKVRNSWSRQTGQRADTEKRWNDLLDCLTQSEAGVAQ